MWLACPDDRAGVAPADSDVTWSEGGPNCDIGDTITGVLGLVPPDRPPADDAEETGWIAEPCPAATAFVGGLLAFLGLASCPGRARGPDVTARTAPAAAPATPERPGRV